MSLAKMPGAKIIPSPNITNTFNFTLISVNSISIIYNQGPCQGDSGAPLFTQDIADNGDRVNLTLVGIHSGAASCGSKRKKDLPAWWVRVSHKVCIEVLNCDVLWKQAIQK